MRDYSPDSPRRRRVTERLAYSVAELQEALGISRRVAYRLAAKIGVRVSERRIVVPATRVWELLEGKER
jgi:hypothetical protein